MGKLSESLLQQWIREGAPIAGQADGNGLTFTLSPAGTAAWTLRYSHGGKRKELTLGRYPAIDLEAARAAAQIERAKVALGYDVAADKQARRLTVVCGRRIELLTHDVVKAEAELRHLQEAAKVARARLNVARLVLRLETERGQSWAS